MNRYALSQADGIKEKYLKDQSRRLDYLTSHIKMKGEWYDAGKNSGHVRRYLATYYDKAPSTLNGDLNYEYVFEDKMNNVLDSNELDVITHLEVIEHLLNPLLNMQECYRMLKPGGIMYLTTPNDYSFIFKLEHLLERKFVDHFHQFNEFELRWLLQETGFKKIIINTFKKTNRRFIARFCNNSFFVKAIK